jgi:hypothetical protein
VLVEQEGGPVQGHRGLAGPGAALDDQHPVVRGADDAVLVGLDGAHDVTHPAGAGLVERRQQHRVAGRVLVTGAGGVSQVEDLVVHRGDLAALAGDVPPTAQSHRGVAGGEVERPGHVRPPVDQQRGALGVVLPEADASDVVGHAVGQVDAAEAERALHRVQRGEQPGAFGDQDVPLQPGLHGGGSPAQRLLHGGLRVVAQFLDAFVEAVHEFLFTAQFQVLAGLFPIARALA